MLIHNSYKILLQLTFIFHNCVLKILSSTATWAKHSRIAAVSNQFRSTHLYSRNKMSHPQMTLSIYIFYWAVWLALVFLQNSTQKCSNERLRASWYVRFESCIVMLNRNCIQAVMSLTVHCFGGYDVFYNVLCWGCDVL